MDKVITIGIDMDGCIANFALEFSKYCNKRFGDKCYIIQNKEQIKSWDWDTWYPLTKQVKI